MKVSTLLLLFAAILFASPLTGWAAPKQIIHYQVFSNSSSVSSVVTNHTYIDTLPFDGIMVKFPDYQDVFGPGYAANYTTLYNQLSPMKECASESDAQLPERLDRQLRYAGSIRRLDPRDPELGYHVRSGARRRI